MTSKDIICVSCPRGCRIKVEANDNEIKNISGFKCPQGKEYAKDEFLNPTRILPTTVKVKNGELPLVSVKTEAPIPKKYLIKAMKILARVKVKAPVFCGDLIYENILDTGVDVVATKNVKKA